jgi:cholesterol 25-hydroxylase
MSWSSALQTAASLWANHVFRTWWFDPLTASLCFGVFINWYWYHERKQGVAESWTYWDPAAALSSSNKASSRSSPTAKSLVAYWVGVYAWTMLVPPSSAYIPDGIPTSLTELLELVAQVALGIFLYDAIFFVVHWALHQVPALRCLHARHHEATQIHSFDTLRHGSLDGALQVLVNILVQRHTIFFVLPFGARLGVKSRLARLLHNVVVIWMLTESHTAATKPYIWRRWCVGVREHAIHHMKHDRLRYQQFFGYLDDWRRGATTTTTSRWVAVWSKHHKPHGH